jgi:hypothetical protein
MRYRKYLEKQVEPEAHIIAETLRANKALFWERIIGIPSCGEYDLVWPMLDSIAKASSQVPTEGRTLCCLLINESPLTSANYRDANKRLCDALRDKTETYETLFTNESNMRLCTYKDLDLLCITRVGNLSLPEGQGVGLARKILADIALALFHHKKLSSHWIHQTDADAIIPDDYFDQAKEFNNRPDISALTYAYMHTGEACSDKSHPYNLETINTASVLYETWLRYYTLGLGYAKSPYAYPTIGSTITINAHAYGMIHGFPKRQAGEDFYLLNKLAKVGTIKVLHSNPIKLRHRISDRVPFGTGKATGKIAELIQNNKPYLVHDPIVFTALKGVLAYCAYLIEHELEHPDLEDFIEYAPKSVSENSSKIFYLAEEFGIFKAQKSAMNRATKKAARLQHFHCWLDSFKTMKFIHLISEKMAKDIRLEEAIIKAPFLTHAENSKPFDTLNHLRNLDHQSTEI